MERILSDVCSYRVDTLDSEVVFWGLLAIPFASLCIQLSTVL